MNKQRKTKQAAQFLISPFKNCQLYMLNFAKSKIFICENDLETKSITFKAKDLRVKRILIYNFHCKANNFSSYIPFI